MFVEIIRNYPSRWREWWSDLAPFSRALPLVSVLIYWGVFALLGGFGEGAVKLGLAVLALGYLGRLPRRILTFLTPLILTGVIYDSQRYFGHMIRARIRVAEPYQFDLFFFGIESEAGRLTPNEWWQQHTHWILDLIAGFGYIAYIPIFLGFAGAFEFFYSRVGTLKHSASEITRRAPQIMWSFFWVNMLGYSTYYWYPAAPPWYVALHGLGPAKVDTPPNPAGCTRFDELLGVNIFQEWYSHSADVFGAIPSLHIAYPIVAVFFAFRFGALRTASLIYSAILCFGAVYLNHHYILDVIWGSVYAIGVSWLLCAWAESRHSPSPNHRRTLLNTSVTG